MTARTFVNRFWKLFYGAGLSRKLDDLGTQGDWPTHPQLLDWLAADFVESGWDVKHAAKLMVMSATYRQASTMSPSLHEKDPFNHWLARQARFRLDAEMVRDNAMWISGHNIFDQSAPINARPPTEYGEELTSQHSGGVNTLFGDGSVHFLKNQTNPVVLAALCTRALGEVLSSDSY